MKKATRNISAMLAVLFIVAGCTCGRDIAAAAAESGRALKALKHHGDIDLTQCSWPLANCNKSNADCETNISNSHFNCGKCGNACNRYKEFCLDGFCVPFNCGPAYFAGGGGCPFPLDCHLGACGKPIPCDTDTSIHDAVGATYVVNPGTCRPNLTTTEPVKFWYEAFDNPVMFTVKSANGTLLYGPVVAGNKKHCSECPGPGVQNSYGAACPPPSVPMYPNVPYTARRGEPFVSVPRPAGDTRVVVEVLSACGNEHGNKGGWSFRVGCVKPSSGMRCP